MSMSISNRMRPVHPGEILKEELQEIGMSANALAKALWVPANRITSILNGSRAVTADTSLRLIPLPGHEPRILAEPPENVRTAHHSNFVGNAHQHDDPATSRKSVTYSFLRLISANAPDHRYPSPEETGGTESTCLLMAATPSRWTRYPCSTPGSTSDRTFRTNVSMS